MKQQLRSRIYSPFILFAQVMISTLAEAPGAEAETLTPAAVSNFNSYVSIVESRLALQHRSRNAFLVPGGSLAEKEAMLRRGELIVERVTPSGRAVASGAMIHHWRGTAFAAGARAADFELLMKDFNAYPFRFAPQVLWTKVLAQQGNLFQASMRVRQKHVITVVLDIAYDVSFGRLDAGHGYSSARSTRVSEIDSPGTPSERALSSAEEHGFLWRLNTYWSYEERDGGLYLQIESVSFTRSIPLALDWAVRPFVDSVPRESLEFTLGSVCRALRK